MRTTLTTLAAIVALGVLGLWVWTPSPAEYRAGQQVASARAGLEVERARLAADAEAHQAALDRERAQEWRGYEAAWIAPAWATFYATTGAAGALVVGALALGAVALVGLGVFMLADTYLLRRRKSALVWADSSGRLPVEVGQVRSLTGAAVGLLEQHAKTNHARAVALAQSAGQQVPQTLTYSPHVSIRQDAHPAPALPPVMEEAEPTPPAISVPSFARLLAEGDIGPGSPLILGYDSSTGEPLQGSWLDLYSTAVAGLSGSGKTTSQRFLASQVALHGAKFAIIDPHAGAAEDALAGTLAPLSRLFLCEPASTDKQILEVARLVRDIGERRVKGLDRDRTPVIMWIDETTSLLARSKIGEELGALMEAIAQEYRKRFVFVCASGQIWSAARTGGNSALRDSFASVLCHRMKRGQARLLLPTEEAATVERLGTGQAVLWRTSGESQVITVPNTTAADVATIGQFLERGENGYHHGYKVATNRLQSDPAGWVTIDPGCSRGENGYTETIEANGSHGSQVSAEARRAAELFKAGMAPAAIVAELRGVRSSEGGAYQKHLTEVLELLRQAWAAGV